MFHEGFLPEGVREVVSVINKKSRLFKTPMGDFSFTRVPTNSPFAGVHFVKLQGEQGAFIASPLRAIADLICCRKEVRWRRDGMDFLLVSMRVDFEELKELDLGEAEEIIQAIRNKRVKEYFVNLVKELR